MATVRITSTYDVRAAINYASNGKAHQEHENVQERVLAKGGNNLSNVDDAIYQMRLVQKAYGKENGFVQAYRITQSFAEDELSKDNPDDIQKANEMGVEFAKKAYPNNQVAVYTQADGKSGHLHNHIIVNAVCLDGRSLRGTERHFKTIAKVNDEVLKENGVIQTLSKENYESAYSKDVLVTNGEYQSKLQGKYVWKDDLRERIESSVLDERTVNLETFSEVLEEKGVTVTKGKRDFEYAFTDAKEKERKSTARKLGEDYKEDNINVDIRQKQQLIAEQQQQEQQRFQQQQLYEATKLQLERKRRERDEERNRRLEERRNQSDRRSKQPEPTSKRTNRRNKSNDFEFEL